jgi:hypothetical protein
MEASICVPFGKETGIGMMFLYVVKQLRSNVK